MCVSSCLCVSVRSVSHACVGVDVSVCVCVGSKPVVHLGLCLCVPFCLEPAPCGAAVRHQMACKGRKTHFMCGFGWPCLDGLWASAPFRLPTAKT